MRFLAFFLFLLLRCSLASHLYLSVVANFSISSPNLAFLGNFNKFSGCLYRAVEISCAYLKRKEVKDVGFLHPDF